MDSIYSSTMVSFAKALIEENCEVIYGGSREGLMEVLADQILKNGGCVKGVVPKYFVGKSNLVHKNLTHLMVAENLRERKYHLIESSDVIVAFPGGIGTLDEIMEVITLKQLGEEPKRPLLLFNVLGFWDPFIDFFKTLRRKKALSLSLEKCFSVASEVDRVLEWILKHKV